MLLMSFQSGIWLSWIYGRPLSSSKSSKSSQKQRFLVLDQRNWVVDVWVYRKDVHFDFSVKQYCVIYNTVSYSKKVGLHVYELLSIDVYRYVYKKLHR